MILIGLGQLKAELDELAKLFQSGASVEQRANKSKQIRDRYGLSADELSDYLDYALSFDEAS